MGWLNLISKKILMAGFDLFAFLFSALTFFCVALYTFHPNYGSDFYALYTFGLILIAFLGSAWALRQSALERIAWSRGDWMFCIVIFFLALRLGLYKLNLPSVWLDEEMQVNAAIGRKGVSIVSGASFTQMPLSYYFTALNLDLFGFKEWGLRLFPCLFYAGSAVLLFRLAKVLCTSSALRMAIPLAYVLNPWLIRYAQEGRPYTFMLFCGLLWLNTLYDSCSEQANLRPMPRFLALLSCTLFFHLSISFQPVVFSAAFLPVFAVLWLLPEWRKRVASIWGAVIISTILIIPLVNLIRETSSEFLRPSLDFSRIILVTGPESNFSYYANALFLEYWLALASALLLAPIVLATKMRLKGRLEKEEGALLVGAGACYSFGLLFWALFTLLIDYKIFVRYYMMAYPLGLLTTFKGLDRIITFFDSRSDDRRWPENWQKVLLVAALIPGILSLPSAYLPERFDRWNGDARALLQHLRDQGHPGDIAYIIPYQDPQVWEQHGFMATQFYYRENSPVYVRDIWEITPGTTVTDQILNDLSTKSPKHIFLAFLDVQSAQGAIKDYCSSRAGLSFFSGYKFAVCRVSVEKNSSRALSSFFEGLPDTLSKKEEAYRIFDILLSLAEHEKNPAKCRSHLADLKKLESGHPIIRGLVDRHAAKCAKL